MSTLRSGETRAKIKAEPLRAKRKELAQGFAWKNVVLTMGIVVALAGGMMMVPPSWFSFTALSLSHLSQAIGFTLQDVVVEGRQLTASEDILKSINLKRDTSIFAVEPERIKTELESLPWVRSAIVERRLPDTYAIRLVERVPLALWQHQSRLHLIDEEGAVISAQGLNDYNHLPMIVGPEAPAHATMLLAILQKYDSLKKRVTAAIHLRDNRWDLQLDERITLRLPEHGLEEALVRFMEMDQENQFAEKDIMSIDLRIPSQVILRLSPEAARRLRKESDV